MQLLFCFSVWIDGVPCYLFFLFFLLLYLCSCLSSRRGPLHHSCDQLIICTILMLCVTYYMFPIVSCLLPSTCLSIVSGLSPITFILHVMFCYGHLLPSCDYLFFVLHLPYAHVLLFVITNPILALWFKMPFQHLYTRAILVHQSSTNREWDLCFWQCSTLTCTVDH